MFDKIIGGIGLFKVLNGVILCYAPTQDMITLALTMKLVC